MTQQATTSDARLPAGAGGILPTIWAAFITTVVLALTFSFGNVWDFGRAVGVERHVAPLIGPVVDLTACSLLVVVPWLVLAGVPADRLRSANWLMFTAGALTLLLNSAPSAIKGWVDGDARAWGRAGLEAVVPVLLIAWSHVGPNLIALFMERRTAVAGESSRQAEERVAEIASAVAAVRADAASQLAEVAAQRDSLAASLRSAEERHAAEREDAAAALESLRAEVAEARREARRPSSGGSRKATAKSVGRAPRRSLDEWVDLAKERLPEWQIETPVGSVIGSALDLGSDGTITKIRQRLESDRVALSNGDAA